MFPQNYLVSPFFNNNLEMFPYSICSAIVYIVETQNKQSIKICMTKKQRFLARERRNVDVILMSIVQGPEC